MFGDNGSLIDLEEAMKVVQEADVFTAAFGLFPQRLLVDTRTSDTEGPSLEVVEPVGSLAERYFWLGQRRPSFGPPQRFAFFLWPHSIAFLREAGVVDGIRGRLERANASSVATIVEVAIAELEKLERQAILDAIIGQHHHTIWPRG